MRNLAFFLLLSLAACGGEPIDTGNIVAEPAARTDSAAIQPGAVPVRIGELGPSFNACSAAGTSRRMAEGEGLPLRAAPFDTAAQSGSVPAGSRFFICSRSHDQRWFGIVFSADGSLSPACGVSRPITSRRNYEGSCGSGWVPSAFVKVVAG